MKDYIKIGIEKGFHVLTLVLLVNCCVLEPIIIPILCIYIHYYQQGYIKHY